MGHPLQSIRLDRAAPKCPSSETDTAGPLTKASVGRRYWALRGSGFHWTGGFKSVLLPAIGWVAPQPTDFSGRSRTGSGPGFRVSLLSEGRSTGPLISDGREARHFFLDGQTGPGSLSFKVSRRMDNPQCFHHSVGPGQPRPVHQIPSEPDGHWRHHNYLSAGRPGSPRAFDPFVGRAT